MAYRDVYDMLWSADPDPTTWRHKRRHTVLGLWHQLKKEMWKEHLAACGQEVDVSTVGTRIMEY